MRCGCPNCGDYMIQTEGGEVRCQCPHCGHTCDACMGAGRVLTREDIARLREGTLLPPASQEEETKADNLFLL